MAKAKGISKARSYLLRIATAEYDTKGLVEAYGREFMHKFIDLVADGKIDCRQCVDQWAADRSLFGDAAVTTWFSEKGNTFLKDDTDLDLFAFEEANVEESQAA